MAHRLSIGGRRWSARIGNLLILAGLAVWLAPVAAAVRGRMRQAALLAATPLPQPDPTPPREPQPTLAAPAPPAQLPMTLTEPLPWPDTRLIIPRLKLALVVQSGEDPDRLCDGPVSVPGCANPGERDRVIIAGHRNAYGAPFKHLNALEPGDELFLTTAAGAWRYVVAATPLVGSDGLDPYMESTEPGLTLMTCHPYWHPTKRLLILADLADQVDAAPSFKIWDESSKPTPNLHGKKRIRRRGG